MKSKISIGDQVTWNSQGGETQGKVVKIHTKDFEFMGQKRKGSPEEPEFEVKSDKSGKLAVHKEQALKKI